jgi:cell wall assembly regulator SMI1
LPAGATPQAIQQAETALQVEFPDDLRKLLLRHDGSGPYCISPYEMGGGDQTLMAVKDIVACSKLMADIGQDFEQDGKFGEQIGPIKRSYWNRGWIPFSDSGCGDNLVIDMEPPEQGTLGQVLDWCHEGGVSTFQSHSLREWLSKVVEKIRIGVYNFRAPRPGEITWNHKIIVEAVPAHLGTTLEHPAIAAAGLTIRIDDGPGAGRSIEITVQGEVEELYGCEFELLNGGEVIDSHDLSANYTEGYKRLTMTSETCLRPGAQLVITCGEM